MKAICNRDNYHDLDGHYVLLETCYGFWNLKEETLGRISSGLCDLLDFRSSNLSISRYFGSGINIDQVAVFFKKYDFGKLPDGVLTL